jgi:hypothetical protein
MNTITAYLIDPFVETIMKVEHDPKNYKEIYTLISRPELKVDAFDCARVYGPEYPKGHMDDCVYVDDEGLINWGDKDQQFFMLQVAPGQWQPLAGKGLWVGTDDAGNTCAPSVSFVDVPSYVQFITQFELLNLVMQHGDERE